MLATNFPTKDIWLVEVGYFYNWQPTIKSPGVDLSGQYPITEAGQAAYTEALINVLNKHEKVKGLFWWMMEANEYGHTGSSQVTKDWYNAALWDDQDGKVNPAFFKLQNFLPATGIEQLRANDGSEASKAVYDLQGRRVADGNAPLKKGIYIRGGKKMILGE
jgi:arabinogalactan endo-1,4-beta-galactosidase